jgi:hypothetical protein
MSRAASRRRPVGQLARPRRSASLFRRDSVRRGEVIDDLGNVPIVDRGTIDLDHLAHFGLPKVLLEFFAARLGVGVVGGVAGAAIVLHHVDAKNLGRERRPGLGVARISEAVFGISFRWIRGATLLPRGGTALVGSGVRFGIKAKCFGFGVDAKWRTNSWNSFSSTGR